MVHYISGPLQRHLLYLFQRKRRLLLPWLLWYMVEVVTVVGFVMLATVYTDTLYLLPFLAKPLVLAALVRIMQNPALSLFVLFK